MPSEVITQIVLKPFVLDYDRHENGEFASRDVVELHAECEVSALNQALLGLVEPFRGTIGYIHSIKAK